MISVSASAFKMLHDSAGALLAHFWRRNVRYCFSDGDRRPSYYHSAVSDGRRMATWLYRGLTLLLIAYPCALVLSTVDIGV